MQFYQHFSFEERESLRIYRSEGKSIREIARILSRAPSSVGRELKRNCNKDGTYHPWRAMTLSIIRRRRSVRRYRLSVDSELLKWVQECLDSYWSPEIITARWKCAHPDAKLSHSTIYRALKRKGIVGYSPKTRLRRHGKRKYNKDANTNSIQPEHLIRDWSEEIRIRAEFGHWEGDTVYGAVGKGLLVTCVDRKSRYLAASLLRSRERNLTRDAIVKALEKHKVLSLSLDNGSEFAAFKQIERDLDTIVYFADPHAPWQRGSNENINGLVRFFFPKGTDFHQVSRERLDDVLCLINNRPRKCLGWLSPIEFIAMCCT
jgi:transposase, IS30 family